MKQAPRVWYNRFDEYLNGEGFNRSPSEPNVYTKVNQEGKLLILFLYVDDLIFTGNISIDEFKTTTKNEFEMIDLRMMKYFLGIEVNQSKDGNFIFQTKYAKEILKSFRMVNCKPDVTPIATGKQLSKNDEGSCVDLTLCKRLVGSLVYLAATRHDIMFAISLISRFMESPKSTHWQYGKRILRYVVGTTNYGVMYTSDSYFKLIGYTDSDFAGCVDDGKSTSGYVFSFGSRAVAWA